MTVELIKDVGKGDAPSIDSLVLDSTAAIIWPDSTPGTTTPGLDTLGPP